MYVKDFSTSMTTWISGAIVMVTGLLSFHIQLESGKIVCRHVDVVCRWEVRLTATTFSLQQETDDFTYAEDNLCFPSIILPNHPRVDSHQPPGTMLWSWRGEREGGRGVGGGGGGRGREGKNVVELNNLILLL